MSHVRVLCHHGSPGTNANVFLLVSLMMQLVNSINNDTLSALVGDNSNIIGIMKLEPMPHQSASLKRTRLLEDW